MRVAVKNNSPAMQGVATLTGTKWIKPGATVTIDVEDTRPLERLPFLKIQFSEAGVPIGDLPPPPASLVAKAKKAARPEVSMDLLKKDLLAIAKAENVDVETDDNKADLIRKIEAGRK